VPDFKYELKKPVSEGDLVWAYGTYSGTQAGDWLGIPATGKTYTFDAVDIFRVQDGKLAEHSDVLDVYGLFKKLGVLR
jgi:predicted ester cyclase